MDWSQRAAAIDGAFSDVTRREAFDIPADVCYLDGNSLGALPTAARLAVGQALDEEWGRGLIRSWNTADWLQLPRLTGDRIGALIGAEPGSVIVADSTSLNLYKLLHAAAQVNKHRHAIVTDIDNFPTDLYIVDRLAKQRGLEVRDVRRADLADVLDDDVAVLTLTHVDYRTSEMVDLQALTRAAHEVGALVVWDLAHSAGAVPLDLAAANVDFAVGCGYKFLNGGPGAPAFLYVAPRHIGVARQPIEGWHGHSQPFAFEREYRPAMDVSQFLIGTPPILGMRALWGALEVFDGIDMTRLHNKSLSMARLFHELAEEALVSRGFGIYSHRDSAARGSHVALTHAHGYALVQALIKRGVIGDFRRPNILRFGFAPLYNSAADVVRLVENLVDIIDHDAFDRMLRESAVV
ncbi:MAG: kynureninase [Candidatus Nanopelagicales bacterium]